MEVLRLQHYAHPDYVSTLCAEMLEQYPALMINADALKLWLKESGQ
jgi:hypothetical protein